MGYPDGTKGCKLYDLETKCFIRSRDVIFSERGFHDFDKKISSKRDYFLFDFDENIDEETHKDTANDEDNIFPVGATFEEQFMK